MSSGIAKMGMAAGMAGIAGLAGVAKLSVASGALKSKKDRTVLTPRTYEICKADLAKESQEVSQLIMELKSRISSRAEGMPSIESDDQAVEQKKTSGNNAKAREKAAKEAGEDMVVVGGLSITEPEINGVRNPMTRCDARLQFSRRRFHPDKVAWVPLENKSVNLLRLVDVARVQEKFLALNKYGRSEFLRVSAAFDTRLKKNPSLMSLRSRSREGSPDMSSRAHAASMPHLPPLGPGAAGGPHLNASSSRDPGSPPINYIRRNKSPESLRKLSPLARSMVSKEQARIRDEKQENAIYRKFYSSAGSKNQLMDARRQNSTSTQSEWLVHFAVVIWSCKLKWRLANSSTIRHQYMIQRRWKVPLLVLRWCRKVRKKVQARKYWDFVFRVIIIWKVVKRRIKIMRASNAIRLMLEKSVRSLTLRRARAIFLERATTIQLMWREHHGSLIAQVTRINTAFHEVENKYLSRLFKEYAKEELVMPEESERQFGEGNPEPKAAPTAAPAAATVTRPGVKSAALRGNIQKMGGTIEANLKDDKKKGGKEPVVQALDPIALLARENLKKQIEAHRLDYKLRFREIAAELTRRQYLRSVSQSMMTVAMMTEVGHVRQWVEFAQIFGIDDTPKPGEEDDFGLVLDYVAAASKKDAAAENAAGIGVRGRTAKEMSATEIKDFAHAMHHVYGVRPPKGRAIYDEFFVGNGFVQILLMTRAKRTIRDILSACKKPEVLEATCAVEEEEQQELEPEVKQDPTNLAECLERVESMLEQTMKDEQDEPLPPDNSNLVTQDLIKSDQVMM